jgi:DNA-binding transcriptional ArsR family regulator
MEPNTERKIQACKLLCHPTRFAMLSALIEAPDGMCVYEIAEIAGVSQSAASHQLAKLETKEVVASYPSGQTVCYQFQESSDLGMYITRIITFEV